MPQLTTPVLATRTWPPGTDLERGALALNLTSGGSLDLDGLGETERSRSTGRSSP